ncbi:MAG: hypothetical protein KAR06_04405 [Deltaproteobacteria bacterium]|nr:hypothetical protein [Deltaproteobacteria bacterium]
MPGNIIDPKYFGVASISDAYTAAQKAKTGDIELADVGAEQAARKERGGAGGLKGHYTQGLMDTEVDNMLTHTAKLVEMGDLEGAIAYHNERGKAFGLPPLNIPAPAPPPQDWGAIDTGVDAQGRPVSRIIEKGTGQVRDVGQAYVKPPSGSGSGKSATEQDIVIRQKVANLVNTDLLAEFGKEGATFDPVLKQILAPEGLSPAELEDYRARFGKAYDALTGAYLTKYDREQVKRKEAPAQPWKKYMTPGGVR